MKPIELSNLYQKLRARISIHTGNGCAEISLLLPTSFCNELAFYRLVNWSYVLVNEAAKIPLAFLIKLPPLQIDDNSLRKEVQSLRTYVAHNLDPIRNERDQRTFAFVHGWFKNACGRGTPDSDSHYGACCEYLVNRLHNALNGAIAACDLLDDPEDGPRLVSDLKGRIDLAWEAYRFDPIVQQCAIRLGNPGLNVPKFRTDHLEKWRRVLSKADANERERVLEQQIEADILEFIGNKLPQSVRENLRMIAADPQAATAALLLLHEVQRIGTMELPEIINFVSLKALMRDDPQSLRRLEQL